MQSAWYLKPITLEDLPEFLALLREPSVRRYLCDDTEIAEESVVKIIDGSIDAFRELGIGLWMLRTEDTHTLVGVAGFVCDGIVELLYITHPNFRGRGIAVAAARLALDRYSKAGHDFPVLARIDRPNAPSLQIARELGMRHVREEKNPTTGGIMDVFEYS